MSEKKKLIYLLGAGRSGTTMLATILNNHPDIFTVGEMHQFLDYVKDNKDCSCGANLSDCVFWSKVLDKMDVNAIKPQAIVDFSNRLEKHYQIPRHIIKNPPQKYSNIITETFTALNQTINKPWLLDSSKYIARYLMLKKNKSLHVKGIYMVRDVRGVIHSFGKNVQTPKKPLSAIFYYMLINFFGQLVCAFDSQIIRIRYEDLVRNPDKVLQKIENHIFGETKYESKLKDQTFEIPHIIAGNRLRSQKKIVIKQDLAWKNNISRGKQVLYYFLAAPTMILNKYKI